MSEEEKNKAENNEAEKQAEHIQRKLENHSFSVYLYIGKKKDEGWENAESAHELLPRLRIYLIENAAAVQKWKKDDQTKGIVFGFGEQPARFLTQAECDDHKTVLFAIRDARK